MKKLAAWIAILCGCVLLYVLLWPRMATTAAERQALKEGRTIIVYWDRHSGHEHDARRVLIDEFNRSQDKVYVRALPIGYNALMEKLLTSIAGGTPPDLCGLDATVMAQLVGEGCFMSLEDFMARSPYFEEKDFFPHIWRAVAFDGHVWGIPTTTDTYCLLWNKQAFRRAGLDPERPPQTFDEIAEYAARLTIRDASGLRQIGFLPWQPWDLTHMYGLLFNGTWWDEAKGEVVCKDDPNLLRMLEWQRSFSINPNSSTNAPYALDPEKVMAFQQGYGSYMSASNPFYSGKIAMITEGEWQCTFIPKYAPELDWGVAYIPTPEGAPPRAYSSTCIADCIPTGCLHPEAAWAYLEWFYSPRPGGRPSPASDYNFDIHNIPCRPEEATQDRFMNDPKFRCFVQVMLDRETVSAPVSPATQFMMDEIDRQRERIVNWKTSPAEALAEIQDQTNAQIRRVRELIERTRS